MTQILPAQTASDFEQIAVLAAIIWTEHYTPIIGAEQVDYMLKEFQSAAAIKKQIKEGYNYFILDHQKAPAGYLSFIKKGNSLFLSKIYVLKKFRGSGIGRAGMAFVERKAQELDCQSISLTVNKNNTGAINAYEKMGFENMDSVVMEIGNGFVMDDYVMEKML